MPRGRNSLMLVIALLAGSAAFFFMMKAMKSKETPAIAKPMVVALARDIDIGSTLQKEDLDLVTAPDNIDSNYLIKDPALAVGKITNRFLAKGTAVRNIDLLSLQDNLASLIPEGYQAMTVPVTLPANLTNLIQVGNRVDILLTYTTGTGTQFKSIPLMKNVKVIGVSNNDGSGSNNGNMQITLAVTPEGSKTLAYSLKRGTLNVAIRSLSESDKEQPEHFFTLSELFKDQELETGQINKENKAPLTEEIEIIRGLNKETYRFVNGKVENKNSGNQRS